MCTGRSVRQRPQVRMVPKQPWEEQEKQGKIGGGRGKAGARER